MYLNTAKPKEHVLPNIKTYNTYYGLCQLYTIPNITLHPDVETAKHVLLHLYLEQMANFVLENQHVYFLGSMKHSQRNGLRFHTVFLSHIPWNRQTTKNLQTHFERKLTYINEDGNYHTGYSLSKIQRTKSVANFINYLKKNAMCFVANNFTSVLVLHFFDRTDFFPENNNHAQLQHTRH